MEKTYTLKLSADELWALSEQYNAAMVDLDGRSETELAVAGKLDALCTRRHRDLKNQGRRS